MPTESYRFPADGPVHLRVRSNRGTIEVTADDVPETLVNVSGRHDVGTVRVSASDDGREVTVEVPRTWRPGGTPMTVAINSFSYRAAAGCSAPSSTRYR